MRLSDALLISAAQLDARIESLARELQTSHRGQRPVLMCVLKGGLPFAAALARRMPGPLSLDFIRAQSYSGTESSGEVKIIQRPSLPLRGRPVIMVEDILDTGRTARVVMDYLAAQSPASLQICTLLDKPSRRVVPVEADWIGFTIPDEFVVGFGLDFNEQFRDLPDIRVLEQS